MRITTNMLVQQLAQTLRSEGGAKPASGTVVTAKVLEALNGLLLLDMGDGKPVAARDLTGRHLTPGQTAAFEVLGKDEGGALQLRLVMPEAGPETGPETGPEEGGPEGLGRLLKALNLPDTAGNRELVQALKAYRVPLTQANVRAAQEILMQAKGILQMAEQGGTPLPEADGDQPLRQLALKLFGMAETGGQKASQSLPAAEPGPGAGRPPLAAGGPAPPPVPTEDGPAALPRSGGPQPEPPARPPTAPAAAGGETAPRERPGSAAEPAAGVRAEVPVKGQEGAGAPKPAQSPRQEELMAVLKQLTPEKVGFVLKHQLPSSLNTLETLDKLIVGRKELSVQLQELLSRLPEDAAAEPLKTAAAQALKAVRLTQELNPFELQQQLKSLNQALAALGAESAERSGSPGLREMLTEVKQSLDFLSRLNENATFLHVPVTLGQGNRQLDLYVQRDRSGQKKVNPKDTRIFISLDTEHLSTVQCLAEIHDQRLTVDFRVADDEVLKLMADFFEPLQDSLRQLGYREVAVQGTVSRRPLNLMDVTRSETEAGGFDMRV